MNSIYFLFEKFRNGVNKAVTLLDRTGWLKLLIQIIIIGSCLTYLYINITSVNFKEIRGNLNVGILLESLSGFTAAIFLGAFGWWIISKAFRFTIPILISSQIHAKANLAKYLPGYGWQIVGKVYLSSKLGIPKKAVATAIFVEFALIFVVGMSVATWIFPSEVLEFTGIQISQMVYLPLLRLGSIALLILFPFFLRWIILKTGYLGEIRIPFLFLATIIILGGWLVNGYSFWLLILALEPISIQLFGLSTFVWIASFLLGFLIFIIPGSIGVRESIMVFLMTLLLPGSSGIVIALLQRAALIVSDVVGFLFLQLITLILKRINIAMENNPNG